MTAQPARGRTDLSADDIAAAARAAQERIRPFIRTTPVDLLSLPGSEPVTFAKSEHLQVTGSFKARGALSALTAATERGIERVVAASTGNHGAAVAYAGHRLGIAVRVFAPDSADRSKLESIRRWGATIELVAGDPVNAEVAGRAAASVSEPYISPYNDPDVIAGQATVGLEMLDQIPDLARVIVAVGGGGLVSGVAAVVKAANPECRVIGASPLNSAVMIESISAGRILDLSTSPTLSDGTAGGIELDAITFPLCRDLVDDWVSVTESEIAGSLRRYVAERHQIIEGSAAVALAAEEHIGSNGRPIAGPTAIVLCGANIAMTTLRHVLGED